MRGMDEQHPDQPAYDSIDDPANDGRHGATGVAEVDAVLASLDDLADLPVHEHVTVFERAHERLRRALDAPSD